MLILSYQNSKSASPISVQHLLVKLIEPLFGLYRYASEVDVDFVRKSIRAIGQCAVKIESAAERCVNVLLDLISTKVSYVVQESIVVIKVSSPPALPSVPLEAILNSSDGCYRTSSEGILTNTKVSSPHSART